MCVDDAMHVRPGPVDPDMEAHGRIGDAFALDRPDVRIDAQQRLFRRFLEAGAERQGPPTVRFGAHGELAGEARGVAVCGQDARRQGEFRLVRADGGLQPEADGAVYIRADVVGHGRLPCAVRIFRQLKSARTREFTRRGKICKVRVPYCRPGYRAGVKKRDQGRKPP